ncbi:MAG TPA: hypothetical protein VGM07_08540 [Stellaceae bacterium]
MPEMIAIGATDQSIADRLGLAGPAGRVSVNRHRRTHVEAPARAVALAAAKGRDVREKRQELVAAAEAGDQVAAFIGLAGIVDDLKQVRDRLERTATMAEDGGQLGAVAALTGQQTRLADTRAKLGSIGAYAPKAMGSADAAPAFTVNFLFSDRPPLTLGMNPAHGDPEPILGTAIDMQPADAAMPDGPDDIADEDV